MAIDSHMHINHLMVRDVLQEIKRVNECDDIHKVINIGVNLETSKESVKISSSNDKFYSAIGIHPLYIEGEHIEDLYTLADDKKVVAIGEIGIDHTKDNIAMQKRYLILQIMVANELHLPIIIHANKANREVIQVFEEYVKPLYGCVFHCYEPDIDLLPYIIDNGFYISFAGRVTYKNAKRSLEVAKLIPNNLFLVETDAPYIAPEPFRDSINHSDYLKYIIKRLADEKGYHFKDIEEITNENTLRLFKRMR